MTGAECCATGASKLPLSTVLVATVGGADFSATEVPDSDSGAWRPRSGEAAIPDIVQFVPCGQFHNAPMEALARSVLAEVPQQVGSSFSIYLSRAGDQGAQKL
ncbi:hypothetical protein E2320_022504 [Naja naja]|nr:hypothetical protein E2320_022504 [Naja naja]